MDEKVMDILGVYTDFNKDIELITYHNFNETSFSCIVTVISLITSILFSRLVSVSVILDDLLLIFNSNFPDKFRLLSFASKVVELDSLLPSGLE